jgi:hypothetical protein
MTHEQCFAPAFEPGIEMLNQTNACAALTGDVPARAPALAVRPSGRGVLVSLAVLAAAAAPSPIAAQPSPGGDAMLSQSRAEQPVLTLTEAAALANSDQPSLSAFEREAAASAAAAAAATVLPDPQVTAFNPTADGMNISGAPLLKTGMRVGTLAPGALFLWRACSPVSSSQLDRLRQAVSAAGEAGYGASAAHVDGS